MMTWFLKSPGSPKKYACILALGYFLVSASWVKFSIHVIQQPAANRVQMETFEVWKGFAWVSFTACLILFSSYLMFKRVEYQGTRYLRAQQKLANSDRHVFAGMIASSVAHDFNNILMILRVSADRLMKEPNLTVTGVTNARRIDDNLGRLSDLSLRLRNVSQFRIRSAPDSFEIVQCVREAIGLVSLHERLDRCSVHFEAHPAEIQMEGFPILIHQMVMNLMLNAADATEGSGLIHVNIVESEDETTLSIEDNGPGVIKELHSKIFEAFYTTKESGSGLGLVSVRDCVDAHRAEIRLVQSQLGGAKFIIDFPHSSQSSSQSSNHFKTGH